MSIPDTVDLIIDSDLLTSAGDYRRQCELDLAKLTGRTVDLGDAFGESGRDASVLAASGLSRAGLWRAHDAAQAFLAEHAGDAWVESPLLARVGALLSYATLLGTSPLHASCLAPMVSWDGYAPKRRRWRPMRNARSAQSTGLPRCMRRIRGRSRRHCVGCANACRCLPGACEARFRFYIALLKERSTHGPHPNRHADPGVK